MYGERFVFTKNIKQMSKNVVLKDNGDEMFKLQFLSFVHTLDFKK